MAKRVRSLDPVIDENSRVLILGTMPGPNSLEKREYYANPRNQFWKIIYRVMDKSEEPASGYEEKIKFLREKGIALWDVLESCEREGASDSIIRNGQPNDFKALLRQYPNLQRIFFNGVQAKKLFGKVDGIDPNLVNEKPLPSTSPRNTQALELKTEKWKGIVMTTNSPCSSPTT
jgi:hypoxanthine-DNA glycosylase